MSSLKKQRVFASRRPRVAVLVESMMPSGRQVLTGIARYVHQAGPWSIYYEQSPVQNRMPDWLKKWRGDGILTRIRSREAAAALLAKKIPVVDILGDVLHPDIPSITVDNRAIVELAVGHLLERGFRQFAYCGVRGRMWSQRRYDYFSETLARLGYDFHRHQLPPFNDKTWFSETQQNRLVNWIGRLSKPVGIMACNDMTAQKVLEACRQAGVMVPEEVAVIGVDNDEPICQICDPMLSSVMAGHDQNGFRGAELLDQLMRGKPAPKEPLTVGVPDIVVRQSTDAQTVGNLDVVAAVRFIRENAYSGIGVEDVAGHVAVSYSTLNRRFHRVLSRSIHDEILRVRIQRTRELLMDTKMTLSKIAQVVGFNHQEYFGKIFKASVGMTPGQFRRETTKE